MSDNINYTYDILIYPQTNIISDVTNSDITCN